MLYAARVDGSHKEILPRPLIQGSMLTRIQALVGVTGGFCLVGQIANGKNLFLAHYDCILRQCTTHDLGVDSSRFVSGWRYDAGRHAIFLNKNTSFDLTLGTILQNQPGICGFQDTDFLVRGSKSQRFLVWESENHEHSPRQMVVLDASTGTLELLDDGLRPWLSVQPLADGKPMLADCVLENAELRANTLALVYSSLGATKALRLAVFLIPDGNPLCNFDSPSSIGALSKDGRLLARWPREPKSFFAVHDVMRGGEAILSLTRGKYHNRLHYYLKPGGLLVTIGNLGHFLGWENGKFTSIVVRSVDEFLKRSKNRFRGLISVDWDVEQMAKVKSGVASYLLKRANPRLITSAESSLIAAADDLGHIVLCQKPARLLCIFFFFRENLAAWMPDGTRWGPAHLIGGPATPGALEKIGVRLLQGEQEGEGGQA